MIFVHQFTPINTNWGLGLESRESLEGLESCWINRLVEDT